MSEQKLKVEIGWLEVVGHYAEFELTQAQAKQLQDAIAAGWLDGKKLRMLQEFGIDLDAHCGWDNDGRDFENIEINEVTDQDGNEVEL